MAIDDLVSSAKNLYSNTSKYVKGAAFAAILPVLGYSQVTLTPTATSPNVFGQNDDINYTGVAVIGSGSVTGSTLSKNYTFNQSFANQGSYVNSGGVTDLGKTADGL